MAFNDCLTCAARLPRLIPGEGKGPAQSRNGKQKGGGKMVPKKMRAIVAAVAALFMFADIAAAMPIAPMNDDSGISPIFVRRTRRRRTRRLPRRRRTRLSWRRRSRLPRRRRARWGLSWRGSSWRGLSWRRLSRRRLSRWPCGRRRGRGAWGRGYGWPAGGAIAAGAAVGFLTAGAAAAYATSRAPAAGLCWYYRDASRRSGFWDTCP